ncbi:hypothetical protein [Acetilactobacillus jinshanensis]|uniref:Uncharacterized protein n=1 Tax=Acetilactobacillus jinshanensis TaxID=1720083 RepID=A0A4P6ZKZ8_9LACO|nr:hypothetical protein [Acetilactobacillus jinshanensis]QBP18495.1 hypothetical protein ELX58_04970 [Acetilactobacillus jinshanensis]URL61366.1 hypothetical protein HGK75_05085 [uncultured bacterium]
MQDPKFTSQSLLAIAFVMWVLTALFWLIYLYKSHNGIILPIVITIFAVCTTGMYLNETK